MSGLLTLVVIYTYTMLQWQPDRSYEHVKLWNDVLEEHAKALQLELKHERDRKRQERMKSLQQEIANATSTNLTSTTHYLRGKDGVKQPPEQFDRFYSTFLLFWIGSTIARVYLRASIQQSTTSRSSIRERRLAREEQQRRFQQWVDRLNQQRRENGQPALSMESLQLVMREQLSGNDYDQLLQFHEEAASVATQAGASDEEIRRLPSRTLRADDDLLQSHDEERNHCPICLEAYEVGEDVRTIPCFHSFHAHCCDPWLRQKAICPVCKHPALA